MWLIKTNAFLGVYGEYVVGELMADDLEELEEVGSNAAVLQFVVADLGHYGQNRQEHRRRVLLLALILLIVGIAVSVMAMAVFPRFPIFLGRRRGFVLGCFGRLRVLIL